MSAGGILFSEIARQSAGAWWSYDITTAPATNDWRSIAASGNLKYIIAFSTGSTLTGIWISSDYGATWTNVDTGNGSLCMCVSGTGQYMYYEMSGWIYVSNNYGVSFTKTYAPTGDAFSINCSYSGQYVYAGSANGNTNYSTNFGVTWAFTTIAGLTSTVWNAVCVSADGQGIFLSTQTAGTGPVYALSTNGGTSWTTSTLPSAVSSATAYAACSTDFTKIIVGSRSLGYVWISTNNGTSFTQYPVQPGGAGSGSVGVGCSSNGQVMFFIDQGGFISKSSNYGTTWTQFSSRSTFWRGVGVASNGTGMITTIASTAGGIHKAVFKNTYSKSNPVSDPNWSSRTALLQLNGNTVDETGSVWTYVGGTPVFSSAFIPLTQGLNNSPASSYIQSTNLSQSNFGTGIWAVEFVIRCMPSASSAAYITYSNYDGSSHGMYLSIDSLSSSSPPGTATLIGPPGFSISTTASGYNLADGNWHFVQVIKDASNNVTIRAAPMSTPGATTTVIGPAVSGSGVLFTSAQLMWIGELSGYTAGLPLTGMQMFRITKGVVPSFTVPNALWPPGP